jgi:hypothetical protein
LPILISGVSVTLALCAFAYQAYRAGFNQSVDLLWLPFALSRERSSGVT